MNKLCFIKFYLLTLIVTSELHCNNEPIISLSIPGSGSHLMMKCLKILTHKKEQFLPWVPMNGKVDERYLNSITNLIEKRSDQFISWGHLVHSDELEKFFELKKYKFLFIYRDPRGQVAAWARWNLKNSKAGEKLLDQRIMSLITDSEFYSFAKNIQGINGLYEAYMPWASSKNVLAIKFEDLVGPRGGGSWEKQHEAVTKIATHLGLKLNPKEIDDACSKLFGGTLTFKGGQIDGWKEFFSDEHKKTFKHCAGQLLVDLGYEESLDWKSSSRTIK